MSNSKTKVVIDSMELTDEERVLLYESVETAWQSQLDALNDAMNSPEGHDPESLDAMQKRLGMLHQLQKRIAKP
jgi:phosphate uptake regulator